MAGELLKPNDSLIEFINLILPFEPCQEALDWLQSFVDADDRAKCSDALTACETDPAYDDSWSVWCITVTYNYVDGDFRKSWVKRITDPMIAFKLYTSLTALSGAEEDDLKKIFQGKVPAAESLLDSGVIKRKKDKTT